MYQSTKSFGHELGISCAFRQWRATHSHCRFLHGYALSFKFVFEAEELDGRNWVMDFGGLKDLKADLQMAFDHKTVIALDDPQLKFFEDAQELGVLELTTLPHVGCEKFAEYAYSLAANLLDTYGYDEGVRVVSCEVAEHGANSATYFPTGKSGNHVQD